MIGRDMFPGPPTPVPAATPGELCTIDEATWYTLQPEVDVGIDWTLSEAAPWLAVEHDPLPLSVDVREPK